MLEVGCKVACRKQVQATEGSADVGLSTELQSQSEVTLSHLFNTTSFSSDYFLCVKLLFIFLMTRNMFSGVCFFSGGGSFLLKLNFCCF